MTPGVREIWSFLDRWGELKLEVRTDTLTGTLHYAGERVAMGTMVYKYQDRRTPDPVKALARSIKDLKCGWTIHCWSRP